VSFSLSVSLSLVTGLTCSRLLVYTGQPLSLLLKQSTLIKELALYDVVNAPGVAADISHINTPSVVTGYLPADGGLEKALKGADIVVIPAGVPRKPGMTRDDLFNINASIVRDIAVGIAAHAPKAFVLVISNPVNSTVPIVAEVLKKKGVFDPKR
jgi:malate dehydrogenase